MNNGNCFHSNASLLLGTDDSFSLTLGKRSQLQCIPNYYYEDANWRCKTKKKIYAKRIHNWVKKQQNAASRKKRIFTNKWHCFRFCADHGKRHCNYFPYAALSCHKKNSEMRTVFFCVVVFAFIFSFFWIYDERMEQKQIFAKQTQHSETFFTISLRAQRRQSGRRVCLCLTDSLEIDTYPRNIHFTVAGGLLAFSSSFATKW